MQRHTQGGEQSNSDIDWPLTVALNDMCDTAYRRLQSIRRQMAEAEQERAMYGAQWAHLTRDAMRAAKVTPQELLVRDTPDLNMREARWLDACARFARLDIQRQVEAESVRSQVLNLLYTDDGPVNVRAVSLDGRPFRRYTMRHGEYTRVGDKSTDPTDVSGEFFDVNADEGYLLVGDHEHCVQVHFYAPDSFERSVDVQVVQA